MVEVEISTWKKLNGNWEVTVKKSGIREGYLGDDPKQFRVFKDRKQAQKYSMSVFKKYAKGSNYVTLHDPNMFGQETEGGWGAPQGVREYFVGYEEGKIWRNDYKK